MNIKELQEKYPHRFQAEYEKWYEYACDYEWWEYTYDWYKEQMLAHGVRVDDIEFSGFGSQGDYANWCGIINNPKLFLETTFLQERHLAFHALTSETSDYPISIGNSSIYYRCIPSITIDDLGSGYYDESMTLTGTLFAGLSFHEVEEMVDADGLESDIKEWVKDQWAELYKTLRDEYEGMTSEEAFIEHCEANDEEFDDETDTDSD